jgi:hypothetical protein
VFPANVLNIIGQRFGNLKVKEDSGLRDRRGQMKMKERGGMLNDLDF